MDLEAWGFTLRVSDFASESYDGTSRPHPPSLKLRRDTQAGFNGSRFMACSPMVPGFKKKQISPQGVGGD
jgi:hypothetical protein